MTAIDATATAALVLAPNAASALVQFAVARASGGAPPRRCRPTRLQPPGYVFGAVWPALYALVGAALAVSVRRGGGPGGGPGAGAAAAFRSASAWTATPAASVVALVVALNAWWVAFGRVCAPGPALAGIVAVLAAALATCARAAATGFPLVAALLAPLCAWLAFATALSVEQVRT